MVARVRVSVWLLCVFAVIFALAVPTIRLWHDANQPLQVRTYLVPAVARIGMVTHLVVEVDDPQDQAALAGSWAKLEVRWDMSGMPMDIQPATISGAKLAGKDGPAVAGTLLPSMVGPWWAHVTVQTPGRPTWQGVLQFGVLPNSSATT